MIAQEFEFAVLLAQAQHAARCPVHVLAVLFLYDEGQWKVLREQQWGRTDPG